MKNRFDLLPDSGDQQTEFITVDTKTKKNEPKKKPQNTQSTIKKEDIQNKNQSLPLKIKEDAKEIRHNRQPRPDKNNTDHRLHDRKSGTGRTSQPRKNAGGAGGIGNIKDQLNQDKILAKVPEQGQKPVQESTEPVVPVVPVLTLQEYYQKQGISLGQFDKKVEKNPKKGPIEAAWVKNQRLTVLKTKQDIQVEDNQRKTNTIKGSEYKIQPSSQQQLLGFVSSLPEARKPREPRETREPRQPREPKQHRQPRQHKVQHKQHRQYKQKGTKKNETKKAHQTPNVKIVLDESNFPSL